MGREEQIEEREVLDSIYPDEITDISETSYRVSIALDIPHQEADSEAPTLLLTVSYPPTYPSVAPTLDLTFPPSTPPPPHLTLPADKPHLLASLAPTIVENTGQAMIFALLLALKESAEQLMQSRLEAAQALLDQEAAVAEEEENRKFHGEMVTRESWERWREGFRAEVEAEAEERRKGEEEGKGKKGKGEEGRLSGRELWERGLVGKGEEGEEGEEDALRGVEALRGAE